tara:strand:- start:202 stop:621 length:420 start_codon:yes stop_codon:yes gene_type:complete
MYEIIPDLWVSKTNSITNLNSCIHINSSNDLKYLGKFKEYKIDIKKNMIKYELIELYKYIINTIDKINIYLLNNTTVIVTCSTCNQLSPLIVISYLIKFGKLKKLEAIQYFKTKKENIIEEGIYFNNILNKISNNNINV